MMEPHMTLKELREKMANIATNARAKLDEITDDTDEGRAKEIESEFDAMMAEHDQLDERAKRTVKLEEAEARANEPDPRRPEGNDAEVRGQEELAPPEYNEVFTKAMRFGNASLTPEETAILMENRNLDKGVESRAQAVGSDAAGGYTVPEGFSGEIDKALAAWGPMLDGGVARIYPTATGNPIPWPTTDYTGITGELKSENAAATDDNGNDIVFGQKILNAYLYDSEIVKVSIELLQDSFFDMEGLIAELFGESLGRTVNDVLTVGNGTAKPNGIVTASAAGKVAASTSAITADEVIDMQHSVDPAYRASPRVRWMFHDTTLAALRKLKDGQGNYLWQMGDVKSAAPATLLGNPYSINQAMAELDGGVNSRVMTFGDMSKYVVRRVGGAQMIALRERYMEKLQVGFISFLRVDGELLNNAAVKHLALAAA